MQPVDLLDESLYDICVEEQVAFVLIQVNS